MKMLDIKTGCMGSSATKDLLMACLLFIWAFIPVYGQAGVVTDLAEFAAMADAEQPRNIPVQLEGTVLWSSKTEGRVILHDETATVQLELSLPCQMPGLGDRLTLEGECAVVKARDALVVSPVPVVENNGLHALTEKSGTRYLEAGKHPVQVAWFDRTDLYGLEVEYEGPDLARQRIPDKQLYRTQDQTAGYVNGLDYRYYEGQWWRYLPSFDHISAVRSGVSENFDIGVRSRDSHVGLQFSGFIHIEREGDYTFYVKSDDGSRLFIGSPSLKIHTKEAAQLPVPASVTMHGASVDDPEFQWAEIEGEVVSVYSSQQAPELELMTEDGLVRVRTAENFGDFIFSKPHQHLRIRGVSRRIRNTDGSWVRGEFYLQGLDAQGQKLAADKNEVQGEEDGLPLLTTIDQVYRLSLEESSRRYPVKVRGVITSPMEANGAVLQDADRGIYLALSGPINLKVGDYCEVEGTTGPYRFSPYIETSSVTVLGAGRLPEPVEPSWDQLINGSLHCNYVELEGVVASVEHDRITLLTRGGRINVRLNPAGMEMPHNALGATVRLRGCLRADWDGISRRVMVGSIFLDQRWIMVVQPAPDDPFRIGYKRVDDLLQFDPEAGALQRVRVYGLLIHKGRDVCCLMDGRSGLRFVPANGISAAVGDMVDVAGFLELGGAAPVLREAMVRTTEQAEMPVPKTLKPEDLLSDEHDSTYVNVEGVLLGINVHADRIALELQNRLRRFEAEITGTFDYETLVPGSRLQLTGAYIGLGGNRVLGQPINSFKLLLNSDADIAVLSRPPWWTLQRMLNMMALLAAVLTAALIWIKLLHRKVEQRTAELGNQIRERQRAENQRKIEQERARLAHDLHDDLGARLTEVNMLATLVKSAFTTDAERKNYAEELSDIALHMVTSLDEIVWAVNPRNDTVSSLAGYFGAYAQRLLELASITCGLDVADNLPSLSLDPRFRRGIFLAFKESLANVIQHANAAKVWLRIFVQDNDLVVIVSDDGSGIIPDEREVGADGLVNMKVRLDALNGSCTIQSEQGKGTTVRLQAPIQRGLE